MEHRRLTEYIRISKVTKTTLSDCKLFPTETYDNVITRLLEEVDVDGTR